MSRHYKDVRSFPGRLRRKWVFVAIGAVLVLLINRYHPFERAALAPAAPESPANAQISRAEGEAQGARLAALSPDVGVSHPYADALPAQEPETPAWKRNAVPVSVPSGALKIAIVIDDLGLDSARGRRTEDLPAPLTLAFLPYAPKVAEKARAARAKGHEILVHMPMEPLGAQADSGPVTLKESMSPEDFRRLLESNLDALDGYVGINNHMGSRLTSDAGAMALVMEALAARGLLFLDSRTTPETVAERTAQAHGVPSLARDVFLDDDPSPAAVRESLRRLEETARRKGSAVAIGHPKDATLDALAEWIPGAKEKGFVFVPVSALAREAPLQQPQALPASAPQGVLPPG